MRTPFPRVILVRHSQTEWSKSGQHTSTTDLPLTDFGIKQAINTGKYLVGNEDYQMVKPEHLSVIMVSPRTRCQQTLQLILGDNKINAPVEIVPDLQEWDYGEYEGKTSHEITRDRIHRGLTKPSEKWDIWRDGCEGGEDHVQVSARLDRLIERIKEFHRKAIENRACCDILIVAHGHILRSFVARWVNRPINFDPQLILDAAGVGVLSYQHSNIDEPAIMLPGAFVIPVEEESEDI